MPPFRGEIRPHGRQGPTMTEAIGRLQHLAISLAVVLVPCSWRCQWTDLPFNFLLCSRYYSKPTTPLVFSTSSTPHSIHDALSLTTADLLPPMAAHLRSALRSTSHHRPSQSSIRHLTRCSPAKAQVQPVTQPSTVDSLPLLDEPFSEHNHQSPPISSIQTEQGLPKTSQAFFDATGVLWVGVGNEQPPDPNKAKLGKSKP